MLDDAIDSYLLECSVRLSPRTQQWYADKLRSFGSWAEEQGLELSEMRPPIVHRYLAHLQGRTNSRTGNALSTYTIHGYAQVVTGWLRWCGENGYTGPVNPRAIKMPKVTQKIIEVFSHSQIKAMLAACAQEEGEWLAQRDRAILFLLLDTGIRASELIGVTLDDLHIPQGYLRVLGKGDKEREVPLGQTCKYQLLRYLRRYRKSAPEVQEVFVNRRHEPLTVSGLDQMLYRLGEWAGVVGVRVSAHTFRHTFAVEYLLRGGDLYSLSRCLGHTSVSTTQLYLRAAKDRELIRTSVSVADKLLAH